MKTRCDEAYFNINWEDIFNEEKLIALGWKAVPAIDEANCATWDDIAKEMKSCGLSLLTDRDWAKEPAVIRNQSLLTMHAGFVENVSSVSTGLRLILNILKFWKLRCQDRVYGPISSFDTKFNNNSSAWSFNLDGLVEYKMPNALKLTKLDGIVSFGPWYTDGQIKTGGDESITYVPIGKKVNVDCEARKACTSIRGFFTSAKTLIDCLTEPPSKLMQRTVKFCLIDATSSKIQSALWAHTVITFNKGLAPVVGFEGKNNKDHERRQQVLSYYSSGVDQNKRKV